MRYLRHRTAAFLVAAILAWAGWELYIRMAAPGRLDPDLARALGREPFVNVAVTSARRTGAPFLVIVSEKALGTAARFGSTRKSSR